MNDKPPSRSVYNSRYHQSALQPAQRRPARKLPERPQDFLYKTRPVQKTNIFDWEPLRESAVREKEYDESWEDQEDFSSTGIQALFSNNKSFLDQLLESQPPDWYTPHPTRAQPPLPALPPIPSSSYDFDGDKKSTLSSSSDFWFETNSDIESVNEQRKDFEIFDIFDTDESDEDHFYLESRNIFHKSPETFLNNSLTNIKNNNSPFPTVENKRFLNNSCLDTYYDVSKNQSVDHYNLYKDINVYSYSNINTNNNHVTKLPIPSSKRPLGFGYTKTDIKQLNNRNYFFNNANRMFNEHLYLNNYNKKNLFYNLLFVKNKNTNKHSPITSLTRPLCFSAAR